MKKVIFAALALGFVSFATVNAATKATVSSSSEVVNEKVEIKPSELPEAVKTALTGEEFAGWSVTKAYVVKGEATHYEINLTKGEETTTVKLDEAGKKITG
jgi:hypothetical protein